jgi:hypothetical protein
MTFFLLSTVLLALLWLVCGFFPIQPFGIIISFTAKEPFEKKMAQVNSNIVTLGSNQGSSCLRHLIFNDCSDSFMPMFLEEKQRL